MSNKAKVIRPNFTIGDTVICTDDTPPSKRAGRHFKTWPKFGKAYKCTALFLLNIEQNSWHATFEELVNDSLPDGTLPGYDAFRFSRTSFITEELKTKHSIQEIEYDEDLKQFWSVYTEKESKALFNITSTAQLNAIKGECAERSEYAVCAVIRDIIANRNASLN